MRDGKLIVICGWAVAGKDTIASAVSNKLGILWLDIDHVRRLNFGVPNPKPISEQEMKQDREEMKETYKLFYSSIAMNIAMGRPLIATATFSRANYWNDFFQSLAAAEVSPELHVIWCKPENDTNEEILRRLSLRQFGVNCWSSVTTLERYNEVKSRFQAPPGEYLALDTSPPNTIEHCANEAVQYILS
jgi:predicted kinase